jgi:hypothetical protein
VHLLAVERPALDNRVRLLTSMGQFCRSANVLMVRRCCCRAAAAAAAPVSVPSESGELLGARYLAAWGSRGSKEQHRP